MRRRTLENSKSTDSPRIGRPNILALRITNLGPYISLRCQDCRHEFECHQPTVAGLALAKHVCPGCKREIRVGPDDLETALEEYVPAQSSETIREGIRSASAVAESWYLDEPYRTHLSYEGQNLGEGAEFGLLPWISQALVKANQTEDKK